jgi:hypothetical protein
MTVESLNYYIFSNMATCSICVETFNLTVRKEVKCENCNAEICMKCIKRFLADNIQEPNCMQCREVYTSAFMDNNLSVTYRKNVLKNVRLEVLTAREKEFFPELMHRAHAYKEMQRLDKDIDEVNTKFYDIEGVLMNLTNYKCEMEKMLNDNLDLPNTPEMVELIKKINKALADNEVSRIKHQKRMKRCEAISKRLSKERNKYFDIYTSGGTIQSANNTQCTRTSCKGYLDSDYECGLCKIKICKDCHEELLDEPHICKQENIDSVKAIAEETKPCPTCKSRVFKIEGCDQMFCVQCHSAFSWNTGMIERGRIHNPHYFEWLRQKRTAIIREIGDIPCGGLPDWKLIERNVITLDVFAPILSYLNMVYKTTEFIQNQEIQKYPIVQGRDEILNKVAIDYMAEIISEQQWRNTIFQVERKKEINTERRLILDMMLAVLIDIFRDIVNMTTKDDIGDKVVEIEELRKYFNLSLANLGRRFEIKCKKIPKSWQKWEYYPQETEMLV